jgi:hypothetical protein
MIDSIKTGASVNYDVLMRAILTEVFNERDAVKRLAAIQRLYALDAVLNEPHASAKGHVAINDAVSALLSQLPSSFVFSARFSALGHHNIGVLKWRSGPANGPVAVTGMDIVHLQEGRIHSHFVFIDPPGQD